MSNQDLASLLADILDESKPLPGSPVEQAAQMAEAASLMGASNLEAATILHRELNPVDEFMEEYLGEAPEQVTQVCETAQANLQDLAEYASSSLRSPEAPEPKAQDVTQAFTDQDEPTPITFPKFDVSDFAAAADLRNFATLVTLNTNRWNAKVKDKEASRSAARANNANERAFETRKNLLVGVDAPLKKIHRAIDEARAKHYEMTVPFTTTSIDDTGRRTGGRLLPNTLFDEYITIMAEKKAAMNAALDEFIPHYPDLIQEAQAKLGDRFVPSEYPNPSSIRQRFDLSFDFAPIPMGDDFKGLAATQLQALAKRLNQSLETQLENAMQDLWARMFDVVSRMAERLSDPDKTFHNTLIQNARDVAHLAGHLNVTGDNRIENIRIRIREELCQHDPKDLREKPVLRSQVAAHARDILESMSS